MSRIHHLVAAIGLAALAVSPLLAAKDRGPVQSRRADGVPLQIGADWVSAPVQPERITVDARARPVIRPWQPGDPVKEIPRLRHGDPNLQPAPPLNPVANLVDPLAQLQQALGGSRAINNFNAPVINQNGLPNTGVSPSDVNGDVGPNHYILSINGSGGAQYIIYNKSDGSVAAGPFNMEGLGTGNCATGLGDAIILYDELAQRWLLTEFTSGSNDLCLYVSSGSNPVSTTWSRYAFTPTNNFPDYPKYGVWPDAYYLGTNQSFGGGRPICALDRARMLAGQAATMQCFAVPTLAGFGFQMLQPLDHDGSDPPPAGANGVFMRHRDDEAHNSGSNNPAQDFLELWELDINWTTPASSQRIGPINIATTEFNSNLNGLSAFEAFPQPNGIRLDPLREPVMFRAAYRNLGDYEAIVGNHVTDVDNADTGGIRWYELRRSGGTGNPWTLFQEGTYALADGGNPADRWMGAIAMDVSGNIGLGYSITRQSPGIFPGLRYVGRLAGDPPGVMTTSENVIVNGGGSQSGNTRWGDYHSMSIDPVDGCTFWFAGNYIAANNLWNTRLASFRHVNCAVPEFRLNATNLSQQVCAIGPGTPLAPVSVTVTGRFGYNSPVSMSFGGGLPSGFSGGYTVSPVIPTGSTVANLNVADTAAPGANVVTLRGSSLGVDKDLVLSVQVSTVSPTVPALSTPAAGATSVAYRPVFSWAAVPQAAGYVLEVASDSGFGTIVASATVAGTSHQFDANLAPNTVYFWRVRAHNGCGTSANAPTRSFTTLPTPDQCPVGSTASNVFFDNIESGQNGWTATPGSGNQNTRWTQTTDNSFSPATAWKGKSAGSVTDQQLNTPTIALPAGGSALTLQFQHERGLENDVGVCYDAGLLEISVNGGAYVGIPENQILAGPYTDAISSAYQNPLAGRRAWCGTVDYNLVVVDLSPYAGSNVNIRFRLGTDSSVGELGWWVDDVKVQNCSAPAVATTTVLAATPDPSVFGETVALTATVSSGSGTPTGSVQFLDGATPLGTVAVNGLGVATLNVSSLSVGAHTLNANYGGGGGFGASSDSEPQTVNKANTTTIISADTPDPSVVGQAVTVNYSVVPVAPGAGVPTGNVVVTVSGGAETCTGTVAAGTCSITLTSTGARTLTATYAGDANFNGSLDTEAHTVNKANTTTTITSDTPDPSIVGQVVPVNFSVVAAAPGAGAPTGNVVVTVSGGAETCTGTLPAGTCSITLTGTGARTLTATYAGDASFNGSSDTEAHTVNPANTTTTITADTPDPSTVGQSVTVNYTVVAAAPGAGTPTGNVVVTVSGGSETCTGTVAAGNCSLTLTSAGARTLTATYAGDASFNGSADTEAHQVNGATTTTTITSDTPDPSSVGQAVAVNYTVTSTGGTPTGNVVVTVSGGAETCTSTVAAGTCSITLTSAGARTLTATYAGDSNFGGSSDTETHTVNAATTTTTITSDTPDPSAVGQAVAVNYTVTSTGGTPTGNVVVTVSGGAETCTGTVAAGTCSITLTSAGARTLTATYAGDANFGGSSDTETHTVNAATTTTTITSDTPDPSSVGQAVAVNYTVTSTGGTPTGNVVVTVSGGSETCTGTVAAGTCSITLTSAGARTLTATYAGDANFGGSSDTETHTVSNTADLAITKTNGRGNAPDGAVLDYVIVVGNLGPNAVAGATVSDTPPADLGSVSWTCVATAPAVCPAASGSGAINQMVNLDAGHVLSYTLTGTVVGTVGNTLANTASIAAPAGTTDPVPGNNSATDSDPIVPQVMWQNGFE